MNSFIRSLICFMGVIILVSFTGCKKDEKGNTVKGEVRMNVHEKDADQLTTKVADLESKLEALGAEYKRLSDSDVELREWADMVVKDSGKGIWYVCDKKYPRFVGPMKTGGLKEMIEELNKKFRKDKLPEVIFLEKDKDTAVVGVSDDAQLTQKMGSEGATGYMNAVVFTLTSVEGISKVKFKFEEGDHAVPGIYTRNFVKSSQP